MPKKVLWYYLPVLYKIQYTFIFCFFPTSRNWSINEILSENTTGSCFVLRSQRCSGDFEACEPKTVIAHLLSFLIASLCHMQKFLYLSHFVASINLCNCVESFRMTIVCPHLGRSYPLMLWSLSKCCKE